MTAALVLVAAGTGSRLGADVRKALVPLAGEALVVRTARAFAGIDEIVDRVAVLHADDLAAADATGLRAALAALGVTTLVAGGATRQDSALAGLRATRADVRDVLVHDAARPFVRAGRVRNLLAALDHHTSALLAVPATATVKRVAADSCVEATLPRESIRLATTPQAARRPLLMRALEAAVAAGVAATDEAGALERIGERPCVVDDDSTNLKVTTPADLALARGLIGGAPRVGHGYDIHRLVEGRPLVLGGVSIPGSVGLLGHSDGDAVTHGVIEALLGAAGLPDIGEHFPDTDPQWLGADSGRLLAHVLGLLSARGLKPLHVDMSIVAERPRLAPWKDAIKHALATRLGLTPDHVGVKARTNEGLDAVGRGEAIAVHVVALVG